jgi:hypothetical protein
VASSRAFFGFAVIMDFLLAADSVSEPREMPIHNPAAGIVCKKCDIVRAALRE